MKRCRPPHRSLTAPRPVLVGGPLPANRVVAVTVEHDEEIEWTWASVAGGGRFVSGYTLHKKHRR